MAVRTQTMVQLTDELLTLLDQRAARTGASRSRLIREAVKEFLASDRDALIDRQIVEGYRKMPQGGDHDNDEWGDLAHQMTALTADQMRKLSEEERESRFEPW